MPPVPSSRLWLPDASAAKLAYELAKGEIGTWEWAEGHNPKVLSYFVEAGHAWVKDDETAWCAAFVGAMLARGGLVGTGRLDARSYLGWGAPVEIKDARPGDLVVFSRGDPKGWQGHVGFYVDHDAKSVLCLGGNQRNQVNIASYGRDRLLGVRRAAGPQADIPASAPAPRPQRHSFWEWLMAAVAALLGRKK